MLKCTLYTKWQKAKNKSNPNWPLKYMRIPSSQLSTNEGSIKQITTTASYINRMRPNIYFIPVLEHQKIVSKSLIIKKKYQ